MGLFSTLFAKRPQSSPTAELDTLTATLEPKAPVATSELTTEPVPALAPEPESTPVAEPLAEEASTPVAVASAPVVDISKIRAQAEEVVQSVVHELPDFITVAVVERTSGLILAGKWAGNSGGAVEVAAANAEIVRQTHQAIEALQLGPAEQLEDILVTLRYQLHLLRVLPQMDWLLYLAVRTQDSNLGLARTVLRNQAA
jgi:predicted regulator of Ras-like GTPase activity (Roadblock/LC7/MglB family)